MGLSALLLNARRMRRDIAYVYSQRTTDIAIDSDSPHCFSPLGQRDFQELGELYFTLGSGIFKTLSIFSATVLHTCSTNRVGAGPLRFNAPCWRMKAKCEDRRQP